MGYSYNDLPWTKSRTQRLRDQFTDGKPGSGDDPIGTQTLVAQVTLVENLQELEDQQRLGLGAGGTPTAGAQDDFDFDIDPAISYGENKENLLKKGADKGFVSEQKEERLADRAAAEAGARQSAVDYLIDECMRIE